MRVTEEDMELWIGTDKRGDQYESERLFIPTGEEFYVTSVEENEDES